MGASQPAWARALALSSSQLYECLSPEVIVKLSESIQVKCPEHAGPMEVVGQCSCSYRYGKAPLRHRADLHETV